MPPNSKAKLPPPKTSRTTETYRLRSTSRNIAIPPEDTSGCIPQKLNYTHAHSLRISSLATPSNAAAENGSNPSKHSKVKSKAKNKKAVAMECPSKLPSSNPKKVVTRGAKKVTRCHNVALVLDSVDGMWAGTNILMSQTPWVMENRPTEIPKKQDKVHFVPKYRLTTLISLV